MESKSKIAKKALFVTAGALATSTVIAETNLFNSTELGSGQELRAELLNQNSDLFMSNAELEAKGIELKCGEGKCGEGKCGEKKKAEAKKEESKKAEKKPEKKKEKAEKSKSKEHKCGEGKCGEGKCGGQ